MQRGGAGSAGRAGLPAHVCGGAAGRGKRNPENRFSSLSCPSPYVKIPGLSEAGRDAPKVEQLGGCPNSLRPNPNLALPQRRLFQGGGAEALSHHSPQAGGVGVGRDGGRGAAERGPKSLLLQPGKRGPANLLANVLSTAQPPRVF